MSNDPKRMAWQLIISWGVICLCFQTKIGGSEQNKEAITYPVNLNLKQRKIFSNVTLSRKVRNKWKGVVTFIVLLFVLTLAVRAIDTFEANASGLFVVNRGPCLIYKEPNLTASTDRITDPNFNVELDACVRIIGALSSNYKASSTGWVYGRHIGSVWESHIGIQTKENNHSAWVKKVGEKNWTKYADNWWEPPDVTIQ